MINDITWFPKSERQIKKEKEKEDKKIYNNDRYTQIKQILFINISKSKIVKTEKCIYKTNKNIRSFNFIS